MEKIKILYLIPHLQRSGPVEQLKLLVENLNKKEYEIYIATMYEERNNSLIETFRHEVSSVIQLHCKYYNIAQQKKRLRKVIKNINPDIIHSNSVFTDIISCNNTLEHKLVITQHNYIYEDLIPQYGNFIGKLLCHFEKKAILNSDVVITCSNTLKDKYSKVIKKNMVAIPNGIDINQWSHIDSDIKSLKESLNLPLDKHIFLSTGLLIKRKDPQLIIDAFIQSHCNNSILVMLGDGDQSESCKKLAKDRTDIVFKGRVNNVKDYLFASDTFISASQSEGLPYAVMEAECTGIKMILSNIPQHHEVSKSNQINFFNVGNTKELISLIQENCKDNNRITYNINELSAEKMAEEYHRIYKSLKGV